MEERFLTVTALTKYINYKFEHDKHLVNVLLEGEISNFKRHSRGHFYFTLKDDNAQISAIMFQTQASKITFEPTDGMKVYVKGRVSVYEQAGSYQIYVTQMRQDGLGDLHIKFERLKKELYELGLFDEARKREIPRFPKAIGVITSPTGAAVHDIINTISRRFPLTKIIVYPALVQGEEAKDSIVKQIKKANDDKLVDVIICGRGGGSLEDLWAFNEKIVAYAIYESKIPIISAVGHEVDFTIADFVADKRAATPTAAAELATPLVENVKADILQTRRMLSKIMDSYFQALDKRLGNLDVALDRVKPDFDRLTVAIDNYKLRMLQSVRMLLANKIISYKGIVNQLKANHPKKIIEHRIEGLLALNKQLSSAIDTNLERVRNQLLLKNQQLEMMSPLKIMDRGYSISYHNNKLLKSVENVKTSDIIMIKLHDGSVNCQVKEVIKNGKQE